MKSNWNLSWKCTLSSHGTKSSHVMQCHSLQWSTDSHGLPYIIYKLVYKSWLNPVMYIQAIYPPFSGIANAMGWFIWCFYYRKSRPYVWRCALFVLLVGGCMIFELMDFPPFLWVIDAHSLWHLATAGLPFIFYRYVHWWHCTDSG